ncbi:MAG: hypothetical protein II262_01595 [Alistipes sp.]|nr:hypothetical protein [Alistipes sp.]
MKKMIYVVLFAIMAIFAQDVMAQPKRGVVNEEAKAKSEALMNTRIQMIKDELQLTDAQFAAFEPVYREYRKAVGKVSDKAARVKKEDLTNENVLKVMSIRLSNTINTASVKQKYLWIFAEIIEPMQIEKLYRIDDRIAKEARKIVQYK